MSADYHTKRMNKANCMYVLIFQVDIISKSYFM